MPASAASRAVRIGDRGRRHPTVKPRDGRDRRSSWPCAFATDRLSGFCAFCVEMTAKSDSSIAGCKGGYALLGLDLLQEGVTPTTAQIQVLKYGDAVTRGTGADGVHIVTAPVE